MQIITVYDFLLLPLYLALFYYFIKRKAAGYGDLEIKRIFFIAFGLRMFGSVAYSLVVQYYYGYGDSFTYYTGSDFIHKQLSQNISNIKYFFVSATEFQSWYNAEEGSTYFSGWMGISSSIMVMKIAGLLSFISFNKFVIISLLFGLFSFAGQWKLFMVFNDYNKGKNKMLLAYAVLYTPSIWFWGSGLMKDSICLGAVGFIVSILYKNIVKKQISFREWLLFPFLVLLVYSLKSYIIIVLIMSVMAVVFVRYVWQLKNVLVRIGVITLFLIISGLVITFSDFSTEINDIVEESYSQVQTFQKNYQETQNEDETSKAGFELGKVDATLSGMLLKSPGVIFSCLFRPFLWESKKIVILFTALESTILLLATLYLLFKTRLVGFFRIIFSNQLILFSFVLSILFALIIGFTTFNFGTMTRYKIMLMPFYYFMLVAIYSKLKDNEML
ncbi:MAG: hypothetical protein KA319_14615 [Ferruginibacter sp.]|nr:hypothetical protein [Ferruginibacter sp.]